jgi:hypothetical protein
LCQSLKIAFEGFEVLSLPNCASPFNEISQPQSRYRKDFDRPTTGLPLATELI